MLVKYNLIMCYFLDWKANSKKQFAVCYTNWGAFLIVSHFDPNMIEIIIIKKKAQHDCVSRPYTSTTQISVSVSWRYQLRWPKISCCSPSVHPIWMYRLSRHKQVNGKLYICMLYKIICHSKKQCLDYTAAVFLKIEWLQQLPFASQSVGRCQFGSALFPFDWKGISCNQEAFWFSHFGLGHVTLWISSGVELSCPLSTCPRVFPCICTFSQFGGDWFNCI